jgi:hypothetical protein
MNPDGLKLLTTGSAHTGIDASKIPHYKYDEDFDVNCVVYAPLVFISAVVSLMGIYFML